MGLWVTRETDIPSTSVGGLVLPASPDRVSVFITNLGPNVSLLSTRPPPQAADSGIAVNVNDVFRATWAQEGNIAREIFYNYGSSGNVLHILEELYYETGDDESGKSSTAGPDDKQ